MMVNQILERCAEIARGLQGGAYTVHLGPVNWAAYDWSTNRRAISLYPLEVTGLSRGGTDQVVIGIDAFAAGEEGGDPELHGSAWSSMIEDITDLVRQAACMKLEGLRQIVLLPRGEHGITIDTYYDPTLNVAGIVTSATLSYSEARSSWEG